jgi:hypothetical protein
MKLTAPNTHLVCSLAGKQCIPEVLLLPAAGKPALASLIFNSLCPSDDGQRMPIVSVVSGQCKKMKNLYLEPNYQLK